MEALLESLFGVFLFVLSLLLGNEYMYFKKAKAERRLAQRHADRRDWDCPFKEE